ncbi:MAG: hypothetical protein JRH01_15875 [Deltaproteobacteria bacterium]|nr:hypothetical protein [Deltaproteobacteria bacterium]MBW2396019.1 hypothetical protein [Deltaproteobacteria bacterium]
MTSAICNAGLVAFLLVSLAVGLRLLLLWRKTHGLPELMIGAGFLVGGAFGFIPEHLVIAGAIQAPWDGPILAVAELAIRATAVLCAVFTWRVFQPESGWARNLTLGIGAALALAYVAHPGPWATAETPLAWQASILTALVRSGAFAWAAVEALREGMMARRRARLGLVSPATARRFLLWGFAMIGPSCMSAVPLLTRWLLQPDPGPDLFWAGLQSFLGLMGALAMAAAFLLPERAKEERTVEVS